MTDLVLLRALTEASAKLQESYNVAKAAGRHDIASGIYAANARVSALIGEVVISRPRPEVES